MFKLQYCSNFRTRRGRGEVLGTIPVGRPATPGQRIKVWLAQFFLGSNVWHVCTPRKVTIVAQALFRRTGHRRYTLQRRGLATPVGQRVQMLVP